MLAVSDAAANRFGQFKAALRRTGQPIGDFDLLIASVAAANGLVVVTNNRHHYDRIPGIQTESWLAGPDHGSAPTHPS